MSVNTQVEYPKVVITVTEQCQIQQKVQTAPADTSLCQFTLAFDT